MVLKTNWSYPTQIKLGAGRIEELADICLQCRVHSPLVITDKVLSSLPMIRKILDLLREKKLTPALFDNVSPNPTDGNLADGIRAFNGGMHDGVVAVGGGSSLDLGKLVALMAKQTMPVWDLEDAGDSWKRADATVILPIIAVPTTAGTGSEVGRAGVLTNSDTRIKKIIFHPNMLPTVSICDPELTVGMPKAITAGTGMDAFAHCLEAYCSPHYHPMSHGIALEGMRLVKNNLVEAYDNPENMNARQEMMSAALMGSTAFQKGLGAIHALSHPIGAMHHTHHGTTNATVMTAVLTFNRVEIEDKIKLAAAYLEIPDEFDGFCRVVNELNDRLNIPKNLTELGVKNPDLDRLTQAALDDPSIEGNPRKMTYENTKRLLEACI